MTNKADPTRVVLCSVAGGVLTAVFGVLGATDAHAEPRNTAGQPSGAPVKKVQPRKSNNSGSANAAEKKVEKYDKFKKDTEEKKKGQGGSSSAIADRDIAKRDKDADEQRRGRTAGSSAIADREVKREDEKKEQAKKAKALNFKKDTEERLKGQGGSSSAIADRDIAKRDKDADEQRRGRTAGSSAIADREVKREDEKKEQAKKAKTLKFKKDTEERLKSQGGSSSAIADRDIAKRDKDADEQRRGRTAGSSAIADREVKREDEKKEQAKKAKTLKFKKDTEERLKSQGGSSSAIADRDIAKRDKDADEQRRGRTAGSSAIADREVKREDEQKEQAKKAEEAAFERFLNGDGRITKDGGGLRDMVRDVLTAGPVSKPTDEIPGTSPQVPPTSDREPGRGDPNDHLVGNVADEARESIVDHLESLGESIQTAADLSAMTRIPVPKMDPWTAASTATVPAQERKAAEERNEQRAKALVDALQDPGKVLREIVRPYEEDWNSDKPERVIGRGIVDGGSVILSGGLSAVVKVSKAIDALTGGRSPESGPSAGLPRSDGEPGSGELATESPLPGNPTPNPDSAPTALDPQNPPERAGNAAPDAHAPANDQGAKGDTTTPGTPSRSTNDGDRPGTTVLPTQATHLPTLPGKNRGETQARRSGDTPRGDTSDKDGSRRGPTQRDTGTPSSRTTDGSESKQRTNDRAPESATKTSPESRESADAANRCPTPNSFVHGTPVLLADGTYKPIEQVRLGDRVLATDPGTGLTQARPVINLIPGQGLKELVRITVDTDGDQGDATGTVTATDEHPFWVANTGHWTDAEDLDRGDLLRTSDGRLLQVVAVHEWAQQQQVHNLTIEGLHTYYVSAGGSSSGADMLVHNASKSCRKPANLLAAEKVDIDMVHVLDRHTAGGKTYQQSGKKDKFFDQMSPREIAKTIREAYASSTMAGSSQGPRVFLRGTANGLTIEMWFNKETGIIETAYPVGRG
ncbi:polymorphic toxin-type HINT domain-containing protein [Amycolatopsis orientalis]|uniref:polymorphic toxin-type HINT domain-containing protein n=1 Tax=Amycolatopsis orientalis TaxID=31958 RepID=UPI0011AB7ECE|nr:polymorphic toxin-type HINT domain-containing protein [Amycolatopsis orientalis]